MKNCYYQATLEISNAAFDKKEAEKILKPRIDRLKALCKAFDFNLSDTYRKDTEYTEHTVIPLHIYTFRINSILEICYSLNIAVLVRTFADINAFKVSDVELYPSENE